MYIVKHQIRQQHIAFGGGLVSFLWAWECLVEETVGDKSNINCRISMIKTIKIILALLLFFCLADLPYGYYQFVRFASLVGFAILAYDANQKGNQIEMIVFGALALLFQPFIKIALGRQIWNIVDIFVGLGLIISLFINPKKEN